jgi:hypothetical protein
MSLKTVSATCFPMRFSSVLARPTSAVRAECVPQALHFDSLVTVNQHVQDVSERVSVVRTQRTSAALLFEFWESGADLRERVIDVVERCGV